MDLNSSGSLAALITGVFAVVSTLITVQLGKRAQRKRRPKDRIEAIFDGYDALIEQIHNDLSRKDQIIKEIQAVAEAQSVQLQIAAKENQRLHDVISDLQLQLKDSDTQVRHLETQLKSLRSVNLEAEGV